MKFWLDRKNKKYLISFYYCLFAGYPDGAPLCLDKPRHGADPQVQEPHQANQDQGAHRVKQLIQQGRPILLVSGFLTLTYENKVTT